MQGVNKAFLRYQDDFLCQRILKQCAATFASQWISVREADARYEAMQLSPVFDLRPDFTGPLAGIEALMANCETDFLLCIPVDIKNIPVEVICAWLAHPEKPGLVFQDNEGLQPLLSLWHIPSSQSAVKAALDRQQKAVYSLVSQLNFKISVHTDLQIGNLNTPQDFEHL
jgi:molybdenum cofactor guanylyltransferase